jgi:hypothetical protein
VSLLIPVVASDPPASPDGVQLYCKVVLGVKQMFTRASDGTISQLGGSTGGFSVLIDTLTMVGGTDYPNHALAGDAGQPVMILIVTQSGTGNSTISGVAGGTEGRILMILGEGNPNGYSATMTSNDNQSSAANQFFGPTDVDDQAEVSYHVRDNAVGTRKGGGCIFVYRSSRWHLVVGDKG